MTRIWGHPNFSSDVHHNYLGQYSEHRVLPIFLHLETPQGALSWVSAVANGLILVKLEWQAIFLSLQKAKRERLLESLNIAVAFE